ncbi:MAG: beta-ketoacyl synthase [Desulfuromonas sp.]|nr:MAG: beta-ketoacyl synthase [Desulfuromonas sp.]
MRLAIEGIGLSGGFGNGVDALRNVLQSGHVAPQTYTLERESGERSFPAYLATPEGLDDFIPKRALRRIDQYGKLTLLGACLALQDAGILDESRERLGVVIASGYGALKTTFSFLDSYLDFGYACSSPTHFSNSVHNAAAAHVSMQLKATAPSLTVSQFEMSTASALLTARQWLAEDRVDRVLFGAIDEHCAVLSYCRERFFDSGEQGPLEPYAFDRQTAVAGEGGAFFVLSKEHPDARYGHVDEIVLGNATVRTPQLPELPLVIGADGHRECGAWYPKVAANCAASMAFAPLYGSFPAAAALDLAAAAIMLADDTLYPSPVADPSAAVSPLLQQRPVQSGLACLKFGTGGDYSLIQLSR